MLGLLVAATWTAAGPAAGLAAYKDPSQPIATRVEDLLGRMTLAEKAAQLGYALGGTICDESTAQKYPNGVGGISAVNINCTNTGQPAIMKANRLGIPASYYAETTHSGGAPGTTVFPMPCSQGASWNTTLVQRIAEINALELRSSGGDQGLSPILQVCTDPRFGRVEENFAEDPLLVASYGVAAARGLQGEDGMGTGPGAASTYIGSPEAHVTSQAKHFAMYGAGSKDGYTPMGGGPNERTLFEIYLRPWRDYALSGGRGVMVSHNMIDWVPAHANHRMVTDTLRNRFGFLNGYVGSDNSNVEALAFDYVGFADNASDAAVLAMETGIDQDMPGAAFLEADKLVEQGLLSNDTLDRAVSNILTKKFAMRLFDNPTIDPSMAKNVNADAHRAVAREAARQGIILLKNDQKVLPVARTSIKSVAVVGPFGDGPSAEKAMLGGYSAGPGANNRATITIHEALVAQGITSTYVQGASAGRGGPPDPTGSNGLSAAVAASHDADLTVVVVGTASCGCCDNCGNGEVGDRSSLDLEGTQLELVSAIANASAKSADHKFIVVLVHGRPVTWGQDNTLLDSVPTLFAAWRPGEEGGNAIVDLIFGDANPSGKLAQAWPRSAGHIHGPSNPWYQTHSSMKGGFYFPSGDGTPVSALFPFAFGLSYTSFEFSHVTVSAPSMPLSSGLGLAKTVLTVSVEVRNSGSVDGATAVIVSFEKKTRHVMRYMRMMAGFTKVFLRAGETQTVEVPIKIADLARYDPQQSWTDLKGAAVMGAYVVDSGNYTLFVGGCASVGAVWDDSNTCTLESTTLNLAAPPSGETWVFL